MERRACTARLPHGKKRTRPCRNVAPCTRVRQYDRAGQLLFDRWVCPTCRQRMKLPAHDVDFRPGVVEISDHIVDDEPYATGGPIDPERTPIVGDGGFRLP